MNSANRSIAKNTVLLYIRLLFIIFIAFFTQRIVLKALGVEDYGIYNGSSDISSDSFLKRKTAEQIG